MYRQRGHGCPSFLERIEHCASMLRNSRFDAAPAEGDAWAVDAASVARRARGENFPVASLLFPRPLRPHLRAVYGYCRLVDILGDEVEGDRLPALARGGRQPGAPGRPVTGAPGAR